LQKSIQDGLEIDRVFDFKGIEKLAFAALKKA
jgi:hypothetical protein